MRKILLVVLASLCIAPALAQAAESPETAAKLVDIRTRIFALRETADHGIITQAQEKEGEARYLQEASEAAGKPVTMAELGAVQAPSGVVEVPQKLTALQRAAGAVTAVNILLGLGIIIGVICFTIVFIKWFVPLLTQISAYAYERSFYFVSALVTVGAHWVNPEIRSYIAFIGCLLLGGALTFSAYLKRSFAKNGTAFSAICAVAWCAAALAYGSELIGFFAVAAVMSALGFSIICTGLCWCIGFNDEAALGRAVPAAFTMLTAFVVMRATGADATSVLKPFAYGAYFLGSFIGYLGLLICSSRWYPSKKNYAFFQLVTIGAGVAAIIVGSVLGLPELQKIGGTFFCLYLVEKFVEIKTDSLAGKAALGLVVCGAVTTFALFVKSHPAQFQHWLLINL